jgi:hypothetical protein
VFAISGFLTFFPEISGFSDQADLQNPEKTAKLQDRFPDLFPDN